MLIVTMLGLLALSEGGHLFKKGLVAGAFKSLFKGEKKEQQHCEIKWEDVWKPHCTTTYEKVKHVTTPPVMLYSVMSGVNTMTCQMAHLEVRLKSAKFPFERRHLAMKLAAVKVVI